MKKLYILLLLFMVAIPAMSDEVLNREGFRFGIGVAAIGGCSREDLYNDEGYTGKGSRECGGIPLLDMELGYNTSNQFGLSLDVKTLLLISLIGIKAKYYIHDTRDTSFVSITLGALDEGGGHSPGVGSYNNIEWGYAFGNKEISLGVGVPYGDTDVIAHLSYKYMF